MSHIGEHESPHLIDLANNRRSWTDRTIDAVFSRLESASLQRLRHVFPRDTSQAYSLSSFIPAWTNPVGRNNTCVHKSALGTIAQRRITENMLSRRRIGGHWPCRLLASIECTDCAGERGKGPEDRQCLARILAVTASQNPRACSRMRSHSRALAHRDSRWCDDDVDWTRETILISRGGLSAIVFSLPQVLERGKRINRFHSWLIDIWRYETKSVSRKIISRGFRESALWRANRPDLFRLAENWLIESDYASWLYIRFDNAGATFPRASRDDDVILTTESGRKAIIHLHANYLEVSARNASADLAPRGIDARQLENLHRKRDEDLTRHARQGLDAIFDNVSKIVYTCMPYLRIILAAIRMIHTRT